MRHHQGFAVFGKNFATLANLFGVAWVGTLNFWVKFPCWSGSHRLKSNTIHLLHHLGKRGNHASTATLTRKIKRHNPSTPTRGYPSTRQLTLNNCHRLQKILHQFLVVFFGLGVIRICGYAPVRKFSC